MPGRIVGATLDKEGRALCSRYGARTAYPAPPGHLQHLFNQALNALAAAIYLWMGKEGIKEVANAACKSELFEKGASPSGLSVLSRQPLKNLLLKLIHPGKSRSSCEEVSWQDLPCH